MIAIGIIVVICVIGAVAGVNYFYNGTDDDNNATDEEVLDNADDNMTDNATDNATSDDSSTSNSTSSNSNSSSSSSDQSSSSSSNSDKSSSSSSSSQSSSSDSGVYYDEELNQHFDSNDKSVGEGQFAEGTSKSEMKKDLQELGD